MKLRPMFAKIVQRFRDEALRCAKAWARHAAPYRRRTGRLLRRTAAGPLRVSPRLRPRQPARAIGAAGVAKRLDQRWVAGTRTVLVSIHSFTPVYLGETRPWKVALMVDTDTLRVTRRCACRPCMRTRAFRHASTSAAICGLRSMPLNSSRRQCEPSRALRAWLDRARHLRVRSAHPNS